MQAEPTAATLLAVLLLLAMWADATATTPLAAPLLPAMQADATTAALLAELLLPAMRAAARVNEWFRVLRWSVDGALYHPWRANHGMGKEK